MIKITTYIHWNKENFVKERKKERKKESDINEIRSEKNDIDFLKQKHILKSKEKVVTFKKERK